ncbi:S41 family peptidase [Massilia sp. GCM10023247]|uniref:S41 family peptidase n=1 Tax=Massilia sp. GCM10023247 TaxID=3252643 RepID=UPI00361488D2
MKKRSIVIPCLLVLIVIGACAMSGWQGFWQKTGAHPEAVLDRAMRVNTIDTLVAKLNAHYVFPDKAKKMEAVLRQRLQEGKYDGISNGYRLARQLTADIHGVVRDRHLKVGFHPKLALPAEADGPAPATQAQWEQRTNFVTRLIMRRTASRSVKRVERLGPNIGYLKISSFPVAYLVAGKYAAAMDELAGTDGLIMDLRQNDGGDPQAVALLISYFVDRRTRLNDIWDRETGNTVEHWTDDKLHGKRYGGKKPVLILAGPRTASAGEDFAYTMQALKRATVIGERTWGGAHPAALHGIGGHFFATIPGQRSISPITGTNWEGVGVTPDIAATQDMALAVAMKLMRRRLHGSAPLVAAGH